MSEALSIIAIIISGCSFLFAVISFKKSHSIENRQLEIEEAREVAKKKASLTAHIIKEERKASGASLIIIKKYFIIVENKGSADARNIAILLNGQPVSEHVIIESGQEMITQVGSQSSYRYRLSNRLVTHLPLPAEITWEDDSGVSGNYETTLTI